ncbi:hypothetical protein G5I_02803 [Acromyrmex echinatior]|uniref:Uncharacterized protein n=1 Tax=Acromyrmex echinatior TaxID=103372 RepID=F4WB97_ACREC|nr:hypothetical protein G5I_02803 [Acromyrmex echinatior]
MEESSRNLLQHKHRAEQLKQEKTALTLSYEKVNFIPQEMSHRIDVESISIR